MINDMKYKLYLQMYTKKVKKGEGGLQDITEPTRTVTMCKEPLKNHLFLVWAAHSNNKNIRIQNTPFKYK